MRKILQTLFPQRRLVLSQFTFFNHAGVAKPTGSLFRRGRRCYRLEDILPIAAVLALKEEGIPLKNLGQAPQKIQENLAEIFRTGSQVLLNGFGSVISLQLNGQAGTSDAALDAFLNADTERPQLFWSYNVSDLARQLLAVVLGPTQEQDIAIGVLQAA